MKEIILLLLIVFLNSCSKEYTRNYPCQVPTNNRAAINLDNFTFYKREIYFKNDSKNDSFIKTQSRIDSTYIRYEIQIMGVENNWNSKELKNVIYFSYIPPYYFGDINIYECPFYEHSELINLNDINYIQFGKLDKSNRISFVREKSVSIWDYLLDINNNVSIDDVTFLDRGKIKNIVTKKYLKNKAIFKEIINPKIVLFNCYDYDYDEQHSNYLKDNILYYDTKTNNFYFEFNEQLKMRVDDENMITYPETWIKYDYSRVRANYVE